MSAAATVDRASQVRARMIWRVVCIRGSFLNSGSHAGFGRVGCGLGGTAGSSAGFCESHKPQSPIMRIASMSTARPQARGAQQIRFDRAPVLTRIGEEREATRVRSGPPLAILRVKVGGAHEARHRSEANEPRLLRENAPG